MRTVLLLVATLAVAVGPALALRCHVCRSSSNCKEPKECPASARYCTTMITVEPLSGNLVNKNCVDSCVPTHAQQVQVSGGAGSTQCCQEDLCNAQLRSAAPRAALSLGLALGLPALLLAPRL
ncbi:lymphocyte antigen 6D [Saimiri boliviensis]|uniref:Lymphocyte antigen 6 family member D n=1 Tax=Saimiri boliviensis boliviensis TaxID=39432 RepID=A0A2K6TG80_SAIBB|nr:lymphocyte antigen 6D [Saimiri boliviensis boliviensis]